MFYYPSISYGCGPVVRPHPPIKELGDDPGSNCGKRALLLMQVPAAVFISLVYIPKVVVSIEKLDLREWSVYSNKQGLSEFILIFK